MNTLVAILKVTDARRDVILAGGLYHRHGDTFPPSPPDRSLSLGLSPTGTLFS